MTKTSFTPYLKKKYPKDNHGILNIRITRDRKSNYISLGESIKEKDWNSKKKEVRTSLPDADRLNQIISSKIEELKKEYGHSKPVEKNSSSFISYLRDEIERLQTRNSHGTRKRYKTTYYHLIKFLNKKDLLFSEIDIDFVTKFETYLLAIVKANTSKNYINCIKKLFNQRVKTSSFSPDIDPFMLYVNRRTPVEKKPLDQRDVEYIMKQQFERDDVLYDIKNFFLFQVLSGMRVRDLMVIRFGNIIEGWLDYTQTKTRKPGKSFLTTNLVFIFKDYVEHEHIKKVMDTRFPWGIDGDSSFMTYDEIREDFNLWRKKTATKGIIGLDEEILKKAEQAKKRLDEIRYSLNMALQSVIKPYSKLHAGKFIFPILKNEDFENVIFNSDYKLSKYQYNQLEAKAALYNKRLKRLQSKCGIEITLTSHLARHTYSKLLLDNATDVYDISKSLGHQRLATTQIYLEDFNTNRIESSNTGMDNSLPVF